jgi:hypothetical protein
VLSVCRFQPVLRSDLDALLTEMYITSSIHPLENIDSHQLALFFVILALGLRSQYTAATPDSDRYYSLACAAFALDGKLLQPSLHTAQTLLLMVVFEWCYENTNIERPWMLEGLCVSAVQSLRLEREHSWHLDLNGVEAERRRTMWWELFTLVTVSVS